LPAWGSGYPPARHRWSSIPVAVGERGKVGGDNNPGAVILVSHRRTATRETGSNGDDPQGPWGVGFKRSGPHAGRPRRDLSTSFLNLERGSSGHKWRGGLHGAEREATHSECIHGDEVGVRRPMGELWTTFTSLVFFLCGSERLRGLRFESSWAGRGFRVHSHHL